jgi:quercetin dioxygenase-like cupin family protein
MLKGGTVMRDVVAQCVLSLGLLVAWVAPAAAQDPVKVAPETYKVSLENASVRVLDVHVKAGEKVPMHQHPAYLVVAFNECKVRFTAPDGKAVEAEIKAGDVMWRAAEHHSVENLGGECHVLNVEMKHPAKAHP